MKKLTIVLSGVSAFALTFATPALAQDQRSADDETYTSDIIVSARRTEERLQDIPVSVAVVSQQQLANRNIVTGADLVLSVPALSVSNTIGSNTTSFSLRGFGSAVGTDPARVHATTSQAVARTAPRPAFSALAHTTLQADVLAKRGVRPIGDWQERWRAAATPVLGRPEEPSA